MTFNIDFVINTVKKHGGKKKQPTEKMTEQTQQDELNQLISMTLDVKQE